MIVDKNRQVCLRGIVEINGASCNFYKFLPKFKVQAAASPPAPKSLNQCATCECSRRTKHVRQLSQDAIAEMCRFPTSVLRSSVPARAIPIASNPGVLYSSSWFVDASVSDADELSASLNTSTTRTRFFA